MACAWFKGWWNWPPLESDPAVFETLADKLLRDVACDRDASSPLQDVLTTVGPPKVDEVLDLDDHQSIRDARAVLVCFQCRPNVRSGPSPIASALVSVGASAVVDEGVFFLRQSARLDAACGVVALIHALLNSDGLLGPYQSPLPDGPLGRWIKDLPRDAPPSQRGRALAANAAIQDICRVQAARGQSQMPTSPLWLFLVFCCFCLLFGFVIFGAVIGSWPMVVLPPSCGLLVALLIYRRFSQCCPRFLDCHFVCLAMHAGNMFLLDGAQTCSYDVGTVQDGDFPRIALEFVRNALLPTVAQPNTCSVLALMPAPLHQSVQPPDLAAPVAFAAAS